MDENTRYKTVKKNEQPRSYQENHPHLSPLSPLQLRKHRLTSRCRMYAHIIQGGTVPHQQRAPDPAEERPRREPPPRPARAGPVFSELGPGNRPCARERGRPRNARATSTCFGVCRYVQRYRDTIRNARTLHSALRRSASISFRFRCTA